MNKLILFYLFPLLLFAQIEISLQKNVSGEVEDILEIDIITDDLTNKNILSYEFVISYDPNIIHIHEYIIQGTISENLGLSENVSSDRISIATATATPLEGSGVLGKLKIELLSDGHTDLIFNKFHFNEGDPVAKTTNGEIWVGEVQIEPNSKIKYPGNFSLHQNYPNPFNPFTSIKYSLSKACFIDLTVYSINGEKIEQIVNNYQNVGS